MRNIKKKLIAIVMLLIVMCSIFIIPAAESKAAACSHSDYGAKYGEYVGQETDTHTFMKDGQELLCMVYNDVYNYYYYCRICGDYLFYDTVRTNYRHANIYCPYR